MNGESSSGIGNRADALAARTQKDQERATKEQIERWAHAVVPHLNPPTPPALPTADWRGGVGAMTPPEAPATNGPAAAVTGGEAASPAEPNRLLVSVNAGDLGELSLVLDRNERGVSLVIGVADAATASRLAGDREALARQLVGSGVSLQSVQIVNQSDVGTVLAPVRTSAKSSVLSNPTESEQAAGKERRRSTRKINVIG